MIEYLCLIFLIGLVLFAFWFELKDREKIPDLPDCAYVSNYCNAYGNRSNIRYVVKEPTKKETSEALLSKIEGDTCRLTKTVNWRIAILVSVLICLFFYIYNVLSKTVFSPAAYLFLFIIIWFFMYWMRNFVDFHYHSHLCSSVKETISQIKTLEGKK
jgi:cbb3-type cytochrome oxidase subunit 3